MSTRRRFKAGDKCYANIRESDRSSTDDMYHWFDNHTLLTVVEDEDRNGYVYVSARFPDDESWQYNWYELDLVKKDVRTRRIRSWSLK